MCYNVKKESLVKSIMQLYKRFEIHSEDNNFLYLLEYNLEVYLYGEKGELKKNKPKGVYQYKKYIRDKNKKLTKKSIENFLIKLSSNHLISFIFWHLIEDS
tara:strand:- start:747 stop:1049 length:303 start_codon:yes stop_codon:yes gene_type:complete